MGALAALVALQTAAKFTSQVAQSRAQARAARANRRFAEMAATDVKARGREEVTTLERQLSQLQGSQRVAGAAQGLDLTQGTMAEIARQTQAIGAEDVRRLQENVRREAWGIRTQADINYRAGMAQAQATGLAAAGTLIGAAGSGWEWYKGRTSAPELSKPLGPKGVPKNLLMSSARGLY